jgi:hypothetical protein
MRARRSEETVVEPKDLTLLAESVQYPTGAGHKPIARCVKRVRDCAACDCR